MTKAEFIDALAQELQETKLTKKDMTDIVEHLFTTIAQAVQKEGKFSYPGFGTFEVRERAARDGHNPRTGKKIKIPASKTVALKPATAFKEAVNG